MRVTAMLLEVILVVAGIADAMDVRELLTPGGYLGATEVTSDETENSEAPIDYTDTDSPDYKDWPTASGIADAMDARELLTPGGNLGATEVTSDETENSEAPIDYTDTDSPDYKDWPTFQDSENEIVEDQWESMEERKKGCVPTVSCARAGGSCVKSKKSCNGTLDRNGCKGNKKCMCCIPDQITTTPMTCPQVTCPTVTPCPTAVPTTCPQVTCPAVTPCPTAVPTTCPQVTSPAVTPCPTTAPKHQACQSGDFRIGNQCFRRYSSTRTWTSAQYYCRYYGMNLAVPAYPTLLKQYLTQHGWMRYDVWIGARGTGSCYSWLDGTCIANSSSQWGWGVQGSFNPNHAVALHQGSLTSYPNKPLDADPITETKTYICERDAMCRSGEFRIGYQCFKRFSISRNWISAQSYCSSQGMHLAEPVYPSRLKHYLFLNGWMSSDVWIGARGTGSCYSWLDGTCIANTSSQWGWGPDGSYNPNHAVALHGGSSLYRPGKPLDADPITQTKTFICEREGCLPGGFRVGNQCFIRYSTAKNWEQAKAYCISQGLQLAQPVDPVLLRQYMEWTGWMGTRHWIGARGTGSCYSWLNGTCISKSSPLWGWGPNGDYSTSWAVDLHNGALSSYPGKPLDADPKSSSYPFVCEKPM